MTVNVTLQDIEAARRLVKEHLLETPLVYSSEFSRRTGNDIYFKLENFQFTRAFKARGALNKVSSLSEEEQACGVIAASSGNHALGVAFSSALLGIEAIVVMPERAPAPKIEQAQRYGAEVLLHGETYDDALAHAKKLACKQGKALLSSFDDPKVIAGQGTIALEVLEKLPDLDLFVVPIGGGGLASGLALTLFQLGHSAQVIGVEAAGAPSMVESMRAGHLVKLPHIRTIADGIAVQQPGALNFEIVRTHIKEILLVEDEVIFEGMRQMIDYIGVVVEPAAAAAPASLLTDPALQGKGLTICCVITGGNIAKELLRQVVVEELDASAL